MRKIWNRFLKIELFKTKHGPIRMDNFPFIIFHLSPLAVFFLDFNWSLVWLALSLYFVRMFIVTGFYHRYFSHRGFEVSRPVQFIMGFLGTTCVQQGPLWWAEHHRHHHKFSERPEDIHSPVRYGFWQSHMFWFLNMYDSPHYARREMKDFSKYPELAWLDRNHAVGPISLGLVLFLIGGLPWLVWGLSLSTVVLWHGTWTINSLTHVFGTKRFDTSDESRNNWVLALITLGEGWHNNHHHYPGGAKAGLYWYEYDITYYGLWILHKIGVIRKLYAPPERVFQTGLENDSARKKARKLVTARTLLQLSIEEIHVLARASKEASLRATMHLERLTLPDLKTVLARLGDEMGAENRDSSEMKRTLDADLEFA